MKNINICYILNNNQEYIDLTLDSIYCIKKFLFSKKYKLKFYVISEEPLDLPDYIENVITPYKNIPLMHQRLYITELLDVDRVIFLDSDTINMTCISKLWETNLEDKVVGMAKHYHYDNLDHLIRTFGFKDKEKDKIIQDFKFKYKIEKFYNGGVVLIDCKKWRELNLTRECVGFIDKLKGSNHFKNEEIIYNIVLRDKIYELDELWNYFPREKFNRCYIMHYYGVFNSSKPVHSEIY